MVSVNLAGLTGMLVTNNVLQLVWLRLVENCTVYVTPVFPVNRKLNWFDSRSGFDSTIGVEVEAIRKTR